MRALGVDVGGTFVDFLLFDTDSSQSWVVKRSSGDDPAASVLAGIDEVCRLGGVEPAEIDLLVHGTTIATNALLQYEGALTGLITTEGFRDVLHIGRHQRPENYSIQQDIPWQTRPLVKRRHRLCVAERLAPPLGDVVTPLDAAAVREAAATLAAAGIEAVAICFLFSYLNPEHECEAERIRARRAAERVRLHVTRCRSSVPRVRALHDDSDQRVRRPTRAQLPRAPRRGPA